MENGPEGEQQPTIEQTETQEEITAVTQQTGETAADEEAKRMNEAWNVILDEFLDADRGA